MGQAMRILGGEMKGLRVFKLTLNGEGFTRKKHGKLIRQN